MPVSKKRFGELFGGLFCLIFGLLLGICTFYEPTFTHNSEAYDNLSVTLATSPKIVKPSRRPDDVVFRFKEYPGIFFGVDLNYCVDKEIAGLHIGDTANIMVLKQEYRRAIGHQGNMFERLVSSRPNLYGFTKDGKNYIDFQKIAADRLDPIIIYPIVLILVVASLLGGIKILFLNKS